MQLRPHHLIVMSIVLLCSSGDGVFGQVECTAPGNLHGIRVNGELMAFSTSIHAVAPVTVEADQGGRGRSGQFSREGDTLIMTGSLTGGADLGGKGQRRLAGRRRRAPRG